MLKALGISLISGGITTVIGALVCAWLIHSETVGQESVGIGTLMILALGSAAGALTGIWVLKRMRLQISLLSGLAYYLLLLSVTALFLGGQYEGVIGAGFAILAGCGVVALLSIMPKKRGNAFKRKSPYR